MTEKILADANPEKRLFISLLTRDISMVAAVLDLIDNSVNAAVAPYSKKLASAKDYLKLLSDDSVHPSVDIRFKFTENKIEISDTAPGISAIIAQGEVFKFGRASDETHETDRLSVYGIGLKRAIFKLGNKIKIVSDHKDGGFELKLDVQEWAEKKKLPWQFEITKRSPALPEKCGTKIVIEELFENTTRRLSDGIFEGQLIDSISRTYAFYLSKFVKVFVNGRRVEGVNIQMGSNFSSEVLNVGDVTYSVSAGIGIPEGESFRDRASGWFVFCNGRAVITADKTNLTGWGGSGLPIFQPKHRPFLGNVFFVSKNAESLPWTTTKAGINEDSLLWQEAKRTMASVGRSVISYLDRRYQDEGSASGSKDLRSVAGTNVSALQVAVSKKKEFVLPKKPVPQTTRIQFDANIEDVDQIKEYLQKPSFSNKQVGKYTFDYFLRNEVGED